MRSRMKRIGEILVERGWVPAPVLQRALAKQREIPRRLCSLLIAAGVLDIDHASRALGEQLGVPAVLQKHLDRRDRTLAPLVPAKLARAWWVLPIGRLGNGDLIVCARDPRPSVLAALQEVISETIVLAVAPASQIETLVAETYGVPEEDFDVDLTTGPIASLDLDPLLDEDDPMAGLGTLELVELDDQGVTRDPTQSGMLHVGQNRTSPLSPSSSGIRIPSTLPPLQPTTPTQIAAIALRSSASPTTGPRRAAPTPTSPPPVVSPPDRRDIVIIEPPPPPAPPLHKRATTEPVMIVDTPPSREELAADAARPLGRSAEELAGEPARPVVRSPGDTRPPPLGKSAAEQAAEAAAHLEGAARLLGRPTTPAPLVIRPRRPSKPPAMASREAVPKPVDDGWDASGSTPTTTPPDDADAVAPSSSPPTQLEAPAAPIPRAPTSELVELVELVELEEDDDDDASQIEPAADGVIARTPATPLPALGRRPASPTPPPLKRPPPVHAVAPARAPTSPPTARIDPDMIAAAYAVPPPAYDPEAIAVGTMRPQRKMFSLPANLPDTLTALGAVTSRDAATAAAMRFAQGRWRAALLLQIKEKSALGEAGHGTLLGEEVVAGLAIPLAAPSIIAVALETRALTTEVPPDDSPVQDRLDRLLGMPRFPAAAPIIVDGYPAFVFVIGDPISDDTDAATSDLERVASALAKAYARVTGP